MSKRRVYLDACLFIAIERQDRRPAADVMIAITTLMDGIEKGQDYAIASTLMVAELLDGSLNVLLKCFDGRKGEMVDVNPYIASESRAIRNKITRGPARLEVADCVHIATAILCKCDLLVTIDGLGNEKHRLLNSAAEIQQHYGLKVVSPIDAVDQRVFDMVIQPLDKEPSAAPRTTEEVLAEIDALLGE